tara:strand:- start:1212 stop:1718 length:507 start_codon:yes stop_codon:yes gene_type:complete
MPAVSIADLAIQKRENEMVVGTHGRGIYYLSLDPIHQAFELKINKKNEYYLFDIPDGQLPKQIDTSRDMDQSTVSKLPISFWIPQKEVTKISIVDKRDDIIIWKTDFIANKGLNQLRWDMIIETNHSELPYFREYKQYIKAGIYELQLKTSKKIIKKDFTVLNHFHQK